MLECEFTRLLAILQQLPHPAVMHHFQNGERGRQSAQEGVMECLPKVSFLQEHLRALLQAAGKA